MLSPTTSLGALALSRARFLVSPRYSASALIDFERRGWEGRGAAPGTGRGAFREGRGWCPGSLLWALALVVVEVVAAVVVVAFSFILPAGYGDLREFASRKGGCCYGCGLCCGL